MLDSKVRVHTIGGEDVQANLSNVASVGDVRKRLGLVRQIEPSQVADGAELEDSIMVADLCVGLKLPELQAVFLQDDAKEDDEEETVRKRRFSQRAGFSNFEAMHACERLELRNFDEVTSTYHFIDVMAVVMNPALIVRIAEIPEDIGVLQSLSFLDLSSHDIQELPHGIGSLKNLETLRLKANKLKSLPDTVSGMISLTELNLAQNSLRILPDAITSLTALEELRLAHNQLFSLPDDIGSLVKLEVLSASHNRLEHLPASFSSLRSMRTLDVSNNPLLDLPKGFGALSDLRSFRATRTKLESLPASFCQLSHLNALEVEIERKDAIQRVPARLRLSPHFRQTHKKGFPLCVGRQASIILQCSQVLMPHRDSRSSTTSTTCATSIASINSSTSSHSVSL